MPPKESASQPDEPAAIDGREPYWLRTQAPLASLIFLVPLLLFYEIGLVLLGKDAVRNVLAMDGAANDIKARRLLFDFFEWLGINGYYLPGLVVVAVLLGWHLVRRDPWWFSPTTYLFMWIESLVLVVPLFVFAMIYTQKLLPAAAGAQHLHAVEAAVLSIGAGIYEELLFRLIGIALLHMLLVDWLKLPRKWGAAVVIAATAVGFALYHDPFDADKSRRLGMFVFYTCTGVYFAGIYLVRGFGIVAWTHALYDIFALIQKLQYDYDTVA